MNTKRIGNIGEAAVLNRFVEMQIPVYIPFGDNESADLVAEFNGKLNKIQVKTSESKESEYVVSLRSSTIRHGKDYRKVYTSTDIDYFAIYNIYSKILLLLPIEEFNGRVAIKVNIEPKSTHNQHKIFDWREYTFEKVIKYRSLV